MPLLRNRQEPSRNPLKPGVDDASDCSDRGKPRLTGRYWPVLISASDVRSASPLYELSQYGVQDSVWTSERR